ncbi:hypothetical protein LSH36_11g09017 [Paralvinella palmiformis]|uniref:Vacuolar protein sorting-associated protein 16 homolog n=1 Tax=Paralvinella palmiformis TaxID=53620 RepID=A0AAD9KF29_9ANNE|nr:hypothetical protein LSH36_11g09017 [Paralvinella palmiformis]
MTNTADWSPLGDVFYRKQELYSLDWFEKVNLQKCMIAAAPYGGPVAMMRDDRKLQKMTTVPPIVYIYSSAGKEISAFKWNSGHVLQMGWSNTEHLLFVQDNGSIIIHDLFGKFQRAISMGTHPPVTGHVEAYIEMATCGTGAIVGYWENILLMVGPQKDWIKYSYETPIFLVPEIDGLRIIGHFQHEILQGVPGVVEEIFKIGSMAPGAMLYDAYKEFQATLATDCILQSVPYVLVQGQKYGDEPPSGRFSEHDSTNLLIEDATLQAEFRQLAPLNNAKVGELETFYNTQSASIVTHRSDALLSVERKYLPHDQLVNDVDAINVYYNEEQGHLTSRISQSLQLLKCMLPSELAQPGGITKKNKVRQLDAKAVSLMADWYERHMDNPYPTGPEKVEMAERGHAASFGKCFLTEYNPEKFVSMCQVLRVLSNLRDVRLGIPITYKQLTPEHSLSLHVYTLTVSRFNHLQLPVLLDRLVLRREYCLAIRICQYLKIPEAEGASRIVAHWACYKVQQKAVDDEQLARDIAKQLGDIPGVSYSEIANKAIECGRRELAINLLNFEPRASEQVPLLLKMNCSETALVKAIESGDTDLVYTVLLQLKETMSLGNLSMVIRNMPTAQALFLQYCREQNRQMLQNLYYQEDNFLENANCRLMDSFDEDRLEARIVHLDAAQDSFSKARNDWAAKQTEEEIRLLRRQRELEDEYNAPFLDMTLHRTIYKLTVDNRHKWAEQLRKEFKVPDRRYWWLRIQALAECGDWLELEKFSKSKKSPIGYEPFIEVCMKYQNRQEAQKYLPKVAPENRAKCLVKMGSLEQAAELAFQNKSVDDLDLILHKCATSNKVLAERVQTLKAQLLNK